jgi:hypothetical protein
VGNIAGASGCGVSGALETAVGMLRGARAWWVVCVVVVNSTWEVLLNFAFIVGCVGKAGHDHFIAGMSLVAYCSGNAPLCQL